METAIWALAPISDCLLEANCNQKLRAGMYECEGCMGNGKRILLSEIHTAEVTIDNLGKVTIVSVL